MLLISVSLMGATVGCSGEQTIKSKIDQLNELILNAQVALRDSDQVSGENANIQAEADNSFSDEPSDTPPPAPKPAAAETAPPAPGADGAPAPDSSNFAPTAPPQ
jgi:hypothetical protein